MGQRLKFRRGNQTPSLFLRLRFMLCLVHEMKIFGYHIGCFGDVGRGFSDTNKKTNYIARLKTVRRIY